MWLQRVKRDPMLARKMFGTPEFKTELIQAVHRRAMAQAGARRVGQQKAGPALIKLTKPGDGNAKATIAQQYQNELMVANENQYRYATEAYQLLLEQFDALTPPMVVSFGTVSMSLHWQNWLIGGMRSWVAKSMDSWRQRRRLDMSTNSSSGKPVRFRCTLPKCPTD